MKRRMFLKLLPAAPAAVAAIVMAKPPLEPTIGRFYGVTMLRSPSYDQGGDDYRVVHTNWGDGIKVKILPWKEGH